jgi:hypothetical protein
MRRFFIGVFVGILGSITFALIVVPAIDRPRFHRSKILSLLGYHPIGARFGDYSFTSFDYGSYSSFIQDTRTDTMVVPPAVFLYKIDNGILYGVRRILDPSDDLLGNSEKGSPSFPDNIYFTIDTRKRIVKFYTSKDHSTEVNVDVTY